MKYFAGFEAVGLMEECQRNGDTEMAHAEADTILLRVLKSQGHHALCLRFLELQKWYA